MTTSILKMNLLAWQAVIRRIYRGWWRRTSIKSRGRIGLGLGRRFIRVLRRRSLKRFSRRRFRLLFPRRWSNNKVLSLRMSRESFCESQTSLTWQLMRSPTTNSTPHETTHYQQKNRQLKNAPAFSSLKAPTSQNKRNKKTLKSKSWANHNRQ
jgi:hypothetical protein